jgi:hypothetical protein
MVKLKTPIKRELMIDKAAYVLTISPDGLKLVPKGKRNGMEMGWRDLVSGDAAMAVALRASFDIPGPRAPSKPKPGSKK